MSFSRKEILPGIFVNCIESNKFKTASFSIYLLSRHCRENASLNALIPFVLRRGTKNYPNIEAIARRLDELYGCAVEPSVRRIGEIQCFGLASSFPENKYISDAGCDILSEAITLVCDILLHPTLSGGELKREFVDSEKDNLINLIESRINNKGRYAISRCIEEMCCYEDFGVGRYGYTEDVEAISSKQLSKNYYNKLATSPIEIFYTGSATAKEIVSIVKSRLLEIKRGEIDFDMGTEIRMNSVEDEPRFVSEYGDVGQAKLVIGYRLGECMDYSTIPALQMFSGVFGYTTSSKLFNNVREKLSLCYYASSMIDSFKGLMLVTTGIDKANTQIVIDEIDRQLDSIRNGDITDAEFEGAKQYTLATYRAAADSQDALEAHYLTEMLRGSDLSPDDYIELVEDVTREDIIEVAKSVECDLVYLLSSEEEEDDA